MSKYKRLQNVLTPEEGNEPIIFSNCVFAEVWLLKLEVWVEFKKIELSNTKHD